MNAYHPHIYVNDSTSCKNPTSCQISTSILLYKHTYENNFTHHHTKILPKLPVYNSSILRLCTTPIRSRKKIIILLITNQAKRLSHLLLSCPNISISGKMADIIPAASQNIVGGTLLGTLGPAPPVPKCQAAT